MWFSDFMLLVQAHKAPWATIKVYYDASTEPRDVATIVDFSLPRRQGSVLTGHDETDWFRDSFVCNCTRTTGGEIPIGDNAGEFIDATPGDPGSGHWKWDNRPGAGVKNTLKTLLGKGCILPSSRLDTILEERSICLAPGYTRLLYVK